MASLRQEIMDDVKKYLETFAYTYCKEAEKGLTMAASSLIEEYYNSYSPDYYDRTYDLKDNSYKKFFHSNGKGWYSGGVKISSENMRPYRSTSAFDVASWAWEEGYHGWHEDPFEPIQTMSPLEQLKTLRDSKNFRNLIISTADATAKKLDYTRINI